MDADAELLLCCARLEAGPEQRDRIEQLLAAGPDWARLQQLADRHGLIPLLHRQLTPFSVPKAVLVDLWHRDELNRRRNQAMAAELLRVLALLQAQGIAAIPYKGPVLAVSVYRDLGLRQFGDLDLLLRAADLAPALALLEGQGYQPEFPAALLATMLRAKAQYHLTLHHPDTGHIVELHWKTDAEFPVEALDDDAWWARLDSVELEGATVPSLAVPDLLLILCLHGSKHHWGSLAWLVDVAELIRQQPGLDWPRLRQRAEDLRAWRRLALALHLARTLLDTPVPADLARAAAATPQVEPLTTRIVRALFDDEAPEMGVLTRLRFDAQLYDRPTQAAAFILRTLLLPSLAERTRWPLPRPLAFLYLPLRLARLAWKHGTRPFQRTEKNN